MKATGYVLDTNICAFYLRGKFNVDKYIDRVGWDNCYISEITELELKFGVELLIRRDGIDKSAELTRFLSAIRILPVADAINLAAKEKIRLRFEGAPCDDNFDLLIGCTSIVYGFVCVTDNTKHFEKFKGIKLENWIARDK
ncbi:MAG: PIN domain-containing protein [Bacteroidales bacterium]|nr:PIN domain-containing protein [Bacteroidales bacterium]